MMYRVPADTACLVSKDIIEQFSCVFNYMTVIIKFNRVILLQFTPSQESIHRHQSWLGIVSVRVTFANPAIWQVLHESLSSVGWNYSEFFMSCNTMSYQDWNEKRLPEFLSGRSTIWLHSVPRLKRQFMASECQLPDSHVPCRLGVNCNVILFHSVILFHIVCSQQTTRELLWL